jgi:hypothetical protein
MTTVNGSMSRVGWRKGRGAQRSLTMTPDPPGRADEGDRVEPKFRCGARVCSWHKAVADQRRTHQVR